MKQPQHWQACSRGWGLPPQKPQPGMGQEGPVLAKPQALRRESRGPGAGQGAPEWGCANEGGPGCIPAPLTLINLIRPLHISRDAEMPALRGAARGAPLHAAEVARGPWEQLGPGGRIAPGARSGHGAPEPQEQSGGPRSPPARPLHGARLCRGPALTR